MSSLYRPVIRVSARRPQTLAAAYASQRHYRAARGPRTSRHREPVTPVRPTTVREPRQHYAPNHQKQQQQQELVQDWNRDAPNSHEQAAPASQVPVVVPLDPESVIQTNSSAADLLSTSGMVVVRQLEMLNVFVGFEQANKYAIIDAQGQTVGYLAEEEAGLASTIGRQVLRTHRPFKCTVLDAQGNIIFRVNRPFAFINSRITISLGDDPGNVIGECQQEWHPWRRRYNLFVKRGDAFEQFSRVDAGFLSWTFDAADRDGRLMASINRNWGGFGRELFTDTGQYALKFDAVALEAPQSTANETNPAEANGQNKQLEVHRGLTLDERAVLLAAAVTTDIDYFSRHSGHGGGFGFMPFMFPFGGGFGGQSDEVEPAPAPDEQSPSHQQQGYSALGNDDDDDTPLPRSEQADQAATSHGWDAWESDMAQRDADEQMSDPWAGASDGTPGWSDFFGDDGDADGGDGD